MVETIRTTKEDKITKIGKIGRSKIEIEEEAKAGTIIEEVLEEETSTIKTKIVEIIAIEKNIRIRTLEILREIIINSLSKTKMTI